MVMKKIKSIGVVMGFMIIAVISYGIGGTVPKIEVNGAQKNYVGLNEFYEENEMMISSLTEQIEDLESVIIELKETESTMVEAIEFGANIEGENRIELIEEQIAEQEMTNMADLELRKTEINTELQNVQRQIETSLQEIDRMQSQLEVWGTN